MIYAVNKMKNKPYQTALTVPIANGQIKERGNVDTLNTQIHDSTLTCLGTGTSIKRGGVKLVLLAQTSPINPVMQVFQRVSKMSTLTHNWANLHI